MMFLRVLGVMFLLLVIGAAGISSYIERQERLEAAEQRIAWALKQRIQQYDDIIAKIATLKAKSKKRKHDYQTILHLEKSKRHLEKYLPLENDPSSWFPNMKDVNLKTLEVIFMLLIMALCFVGYSFKAYQLRQNYPVKAGFQQNRFRKIPDDVIANKTHWQPMRGGGANFQTHMLLKQGPGRLLLKSSDQLKLFFAAFILAGLNGMLFGLFRHLQVQGLDSAFLQPLGTLASLWNTGTIFVVVGTFLYMRFSPDNTAFDKMSGFLNRGSVQYPLRQIHALQIIEELVGGNNSGVYKSYELNLVKQSGERIHLMDHGHYQALNADAEMLAEFLEVPIWEN